MSIHPFVLEKDRKQFHYRYFQYSMQTYHQIIVADNTLTNLYSQSAFSLNIKQYNRDIIYSSSLLGGTGNPNFVSGMYSK